MDSATTKTDSALVSFETGQIGFDLHDSDGFCIHMDGYWGSLYKYSNNSSTQIRSGCGILPVDGK